MMTFSQKTRREKGGILGGHHYELSLLDVFLQIWNLYFTFTIVFQSNHASLSSNVFLSLIMVTF